jgi:hypothetical protein
MMAPHPSPAPCPAPVLEKTISLPRTTLVEQQEATTLPKWVLRDVVVGCGQEGPALDFREERHLVTEMTLKPRQVEQQVTCMESKPVTTTDCQGHCHTEYHPCPVVKAVKVTVYDTVPVQREVVVRVPVLKPGRELVVKKLALDCATEPAIRKTFTAVTVPNEIRVVVPISPIPCPAPLGCLGPGH